MTTQSQQRTNLYLKLSLPLLDFIWAQKDRLKVDPLVEAFNELEHSSLKLDRIMAQANRGRLELMLVFSVGPGRKPAGILTYYPESRQISSSIAGSIIPLSGTDRIQTAWFNALVDLVALAELHTHEQVDL